MSVQEKARLIKERREYMDIIKKNREKGEFLEVWSDESYCHKNAQIEYQLFDPNDKMDIIGRVLHKGERVCIIAAMCT